MIILITASLSSKMYNRDSPWEECVLVCTLSRVDNCSTSRLLFSVGVLVLVLLMEWSPVPRKFPWASLPCFAILFVERNTSITMSQRSRAGNPSIRNPASNDMISDSVELWDTDVCFLHIQLMVTFFKQGVNRQSNNTNHGFNAINSHAKEKKTQQRISIIDGDKCSASKDTQDSFRGWFRVLKVASKVWVLKQTRSTMLSRVTHMTMLSDVICVMNVWNQSWQSSVASLSPFCYCSCKFVDRP